MPDSPLFEQLKTLTTEARNPRTMTLDSVSTEDALRMIHEEDRRAVEAVTSEIPYISQAVEIVVEALRAGGRLVYVGAGDERAPRRSGCRRVPPDVRNRPRHDPGIDRGWRGGHVSSAGRRRGPRGERRRGYRRARHRSEGCRLWHRGEPADALRRRGGRPEREKWARGRYS